MSRLDRAGAVPAAGWLLGPAEPGDKWYELSLVVAIVVSTTLFNPTIGRAAGLATATGCAIASYAGRALRSRASALSRCEPARDAAPASRPKAGAAAPTPSLSHEHVAQIRARAVAGDLVAGSQLRIFAALLPGDAELTAVLHELDSANSANSAPHKRP